MFVRLLPAALCLVLAFTPPAVRAANPATPTVLLRMASIEEMLDKAEYVADLVGQGDVAKQIIGFAKALAGDKGIEGVDVKRPFAIVAHVVPEAQKSPVIVLIPIADKESFLGALKNRLNLEVKESKGVYSVPLPNVPVPVFFRFAGKYLHATVQNADNIADKALLDPEKVIGKVDGLMSLSVRLDQIPEQFKKAALGQAETQIAALKKADVGGVKSAAEARDSAIDSLGAGLKALLFEGEEMIVRFNVDAKTEDFTLDWSLSATKGSSLAEQIAAWKTRKSIVGGWDAKNAIAVQSLHVGLPDSVRKALVPAIDDGLELLLKQAPGEAQPFAEAFVKAIKPTLKMGELDAGSLVIGPDKQGRLSGVSAIKVDKGTGIESAIKDIVKQLPAEVTGFIEIDAEKVDGVFLHALKVGGFLDNDAQRVIGDGPVLLAFKDDRALIAFGPEAKTAIAVALKAAPTAGPVWLGEWSFARLAPLVDANRAEAAKALAEQIFGKEPKGDRVSFRVEGGEKLTMKLSMSGKVLKFFAAMQSGEKP